MIRILSGLYTRSVLRILFNYGLVLMLVAGSVAVGTIWDIISNKQTAATASIARGVEYHTLMLSSSELHFALNALTNVNKSEIDFNYSKISDIFSEIRQSETHLALVATLDQRPMLSELVSTRGRLEGLTARAYASVDQKRQEEIKDELLRTLRNYTSIASKAERNSFYQSEDLVQTTVIHVHIMLAAFTIFWLFVIISTASKLRIILSEHSKDNPTN